MFTSCCDHLIYEVLLEQDIKFYILCTVPILMLIQFYEAASSADQYLLIRYCCKGTKNNMFFSELPCERDSAIKTFFRVKFSFNTDKQPWFSWMRNHGIDSWIFPCSISLLTLHSEGWTPQNCHYRNSKTVVGINK